MGLFGWMRNGRGVAGLVGGAMVWVLSMGALAMAMRANLAADRVASELLRVHGLMGPEGRLHAAAVGWGLGFTGLQILSCLVFAYVLRSCYGLRSAVCFVLGAGAVMAGDALELLGMLVWLRVTLGAG